MGIKRPPRAQQATHSARMPIMLSALVFPGVGQCSQRRVVVGVLYGFTFALLFGLFLFTCLLAVVAFYRLGLYGEATARPPSPLPVLLLFLATMLVYLLNLFDTYRAQRRINHAKAAERHLSKLDSFDSLTHLNQP
jgi:hypothetical protein